MRQHRWILHCCLRRHRQNNHYRSVRRGGPLLLRQLRLFRLLVRRSVLFQQILRNELSIVQQHRRSVQSRLRLLLLLRRLQTPFCRPTVPHRQVMQQCYIVIVVAVCKLNLHTVHTNKQAQNSNTSVVLLWHYISFMICCCSKMI